MAKKDCNKHMKGAGAMKGAAMKAKPKAPAKKAPKAPAKKGKPTKNY